ncbi:MAG: response regulator [Cyclobacteriaceae bacterium]|nr:response regulator [Cyclobacteriaceae bacterium]
MKKKLNCILLIDDDNDCNYYHQKLLTKMNCADSVAIVNDGQQALDFLTTAVSGTYPVPAMIFLDINMPKMNGWEFLKEYEKLDATMKAKIVLVMLTTSLNPDDQEKAGKFPDVQGFKNKFLSKETLIETFKRHFPENF